MFLLVNSFLDVSKYLLSYPGVKAVFSERFNQDPLESFFGRDHMGATVTIRLSRILCIIPHHCGCKELWLKTQSVVIADNGTVNRLI